MKDDQVLALDFNDWPLPETYLAELGRLAALWAYLESQLDLYLGKVAGFDQVADPRPFILNKHSSFPQKLDSLAALCEQLAPQYPNLGQHSAVVARLRGAQKLRNRFAHNSMSLNPDTGRVEMALGSVRGKLNTSIEPVSVAEIRRASMEVHAAMLDLHALVTEQRYPPRWEHRDT